MPILSITSSLQMHTNVPVMAQSTNKLFGHLGTDRICWGFVKWTAAAFHRGRISALCHSNKFVSPEVLENASLSPTSENFWDLYILGVFIIAGRVSSVFLLNFGNVALFLVL